MSGAVMSYAERAIFDALQELTNGWGPPSITQLAERTGYSRHWVHHTLRDMAGHGWLLHNGGKYMVKFDPETNG